MTEEKIIDAIGSIDDSLIEETAKLRNRKNHFPFSKIALVAACICLLIISTFIIHLIGNSNNNVTPEDTSIPHIESIEDETKDENTPPATDVSNTEDDGNDLTADNEGISSSGGQIDNESLDYIIGTIEAFTKKGFEFKIEDSGEIVTVIAESTEGLSVGDRVLIYYKIPNADSSTIIIAVKITKF